jgi:hypothetical protein
VVIEIPEKQKKTLKHIQKDLNKVKEKLLDIFSKGRSGSSQGGNGGGGGSGGGGTDFTENLDKNSAEFHHLRLIQELFRDTGTKYLLLCY